MSGYDPIAAMGDVKSVLATIKAQAGAPYTMAPPLRSGQRSFLTALLNAYGVTDEGTHRLVSDKDLVALYSTANGNIGAGKVVADRIAARHGVNPILDSVSKFQPVDWRNDPPAPPSEPAPRTDYATKSDLATLRSDLNIDYRARLGDAKLDFTRQADDLRKDLVTTLSKVTDALPDVIKGQVADALKDMTPTLLTVALPDAAPVVLGMVHRKVPQLIKMLAAGVNVYLHGPAGSGKTTAGKQIADAFDIPFYFAAKVESEYMLLGFKNAAGEAVRTPFRDAYEHGGLFLFDELDASSPSAIVALNAALANGVCPFPDGIVTRHANFKCIAAGNTKLSGASRQYVGRSQLDAASIDRFAFVEFPYDDALEVALATNPAWLAFVQAARKSVADRGLPHLITPRATYDGCKLLEAGLDKSDVVEACVRKGLDDDTWLAVWNAIDRDIRNAL